LLYRLILNKMQLIFLSLVQKKIRNRLPLIMFLGLIHHKAIFINNQPFH